MKSKKIISLLAVATLATTIFVGCWNNSTTTSSENDSTATESGLKDGTYSAKSEKDERGSTASINIEVNDGKITTVKYDEVGEDGISKLDDEEYNNKMKEVSGSNPIEAFPELEKSLVEKQEVADVDTVTGATGTSETFKSLAEEALKDAK